MSKPPHRQHPGREVRPTPTAPTLGLCPLVGNPLPECYCARMTSLRIPQVLDWCGGGFGNCDIYRRWRQDRQPAAGNNTPQPSRNKEEA